MVETDQSATEEPNRDYLVSAVDPHGKRCVERVWAARAREAIDQLAERGYSEIQLETDDSQRLLPSARRKEVIALSPRDDVRLRRFVLGESRLFPFWMAYRPVLGIVAICIAIFAVRRFMGSSLGVIDGVIGLLLLLPSGLTIVSYIWGPARIFHQIQLEYVTHGYERVPELLNVLEVRSKRFASPEFTATVVTEWRARVLAAEGRLDEALALIETIRGMKGLKHAGYCYMRASAFGAAKEHARKYECYKDAAEHDPENPMGWIGMLETLALYLDRPAEARACLERLGTLPQAPLLRDSIPYLEAMVFLAEGKNVKAREQFRAYLPVIRSQIKRSPISIGLEAVARAQLAIACSRTGDGAAAREYFAAAKPYLELHEMDVILAKCRREGLPRL